MGLLKQMSKNTQDTETFQWSIREVDREGLKRIESDEHVNRGEL